MIPDPHVYADGVANEKAVADELLDKAKAAFKEHGLRPLEPYGVSDDVSPRPTTWVSVSSGTCEVSLRRFPKTN